MESEDNFSDRVLKTRPVLTDVTNRPAKRPFSLISGDDGGSQFVKQVCSGVENLVKKKCLLQFGAHSHQNNNENVLSQSKGKQPCFKLPSDGREEQNLLGIGVVSASNEEGSVLGFGEKDRGQERPPNEGFIKRDIESGDEREHCVAENLGSPKCGARAVELPSISASRDSKFPGLERCSGFKGDGGAANSDVAGGDLDLLKNCTCSFCSKGGLSLLAFVFFEMLHSFMGNLCFILVCSKMGVAYVDY
ncbi:hypothetical protein SESBI_19990 [Sesbania bispinosa]|nr:hypothetical protein SESBI_19990 [Sesbania bispinosa]